MSRALFCSYRTTVEVFCQRTCKTTRKVQGQDLLPRWLGLGTLTILLRNDFAPPPTGPTARTHIDIIYPSFPAKIAYYRELASPSPSCKHL